MLELQSSVRACGDSSRGVFFYLLQNLLDSVGTKGSGRRCWRAPFSLGS
jgi:hypothetical protein